MGVCVILGAGPGLGKSLAKAFASRDLKIALVARNAEKLSHLQKEVGVGCSVWPSDLTNPAAVIETLKAIKDQEGSLDVLIYNAFTLSPGRASAIPLEKFEKSLALNVSAAFVAAQAAIPGMLEQQKGTILFTGGGFALQPATNLASLSIGKAALRALSLCLYEELKSKGIHAATVTICGTIQAGSAFDPDLIAKAFLELYDQPSNAFLPEIIFDGSSKP